MGSRRSCDHVALGLPESVDLISMGKINPPKQQGRHDTCTPFVISGSVESLLFDISGDLVDLCTQQLIDCACVDFGEGTFSRRYRCILHHGGLATESSYPYRGRRGRCQTANLPASELKGTITGFQRLPEDDEAAIMEFIAKNKQAVAVGFSADPDEFRHYNRGIYTHPMSPEGNLNHALLIVGYGTDESGTPYRTVKNSWGTETWGIHMHGIRGFGRILRGRNIGRIAHKAYYPIYEAAASGSGSSSRS